MIEVYDKTNILTIERKFVSMKTRSFLHGEVCEYKDNCDCNEHLYNVASLEPNHYEIDDQVTNEILELRRLCIENDATYVRFCS